MRTRANVVRSAFVTATRARSAVALDPPTQGPDELGHVDALPRAMQQVGEVGVHERDYQLDVAAGPRHDVVHEIRWRRGSGHGFDQGGEAGRLEDDPAQRRPGQNLPLDGGRLRCGA
jgi:hypothetical protein